MTSLDLRAFYFCEGERKGMDYKTTLNMPNTAFEMRGNLAKKEPGILEKWEKNDHYNQIISRHEGQQAFIL